MNFDFAEIVKNESVEILPLVDLYFPRNPTSEGLSRIFPKWFKIDSGIKVAISRLIRIGLYDGKLPRRKKSKPSRVLIGDLEYFSGTKTYSDFYKFFDSESEVLESDKFLIKFQKENNLIVFKSKETGTMLFLICF